MIEIQAVVIFIASCDAKNLVKDDCQVLSRETIKKKFAKSCQCCDSDDDDGVGGGGMNYFYLM